jgi:hypothetical protein
MSSCLSKVKIEKTNYFNSGYRDFVKLKKNKIFYLTKINDGVYSGKKNIGSGKLVENCLAEKLRLYASKIIIGGVDVKTQKQYIQQALNYSADYIITVNIVLWEPISATLSNVPTRCKINISVFSFNDREEIINAEISSTGQSKLWHKLDYKLLTDAIVEEFCKSVFEN